MSSKSDPVAAWRDLAAIHANVHAALDHELKEQHDLSPVEYEVLAKLGSCSTGHARMQELAGDVHLNQSTCSRVVARLEEEGLTTRDLCSEDRRGIYAKITDAGRERLSAAEPTYRRVLAEALPS
ncbi:MAG TPA: MarR family transcriptional regulator [Thermoleophilaceae bacterium]|jgi:DNA-binding MarR family transcriptional regulator|nr:MarR family transcriptional regulator [Thermoleophilaceae bacterium]